MVPLSGSGFMRISSSPPSASREGSVTLKNLSLSSASLALLQKTYYLEIGIKGALNMYRN